VTLSSRIRQLEAQRVEAAKQARTVARLDALEAVITDLLNLMVEHVQSERRAIEARMENSVDAEK